MLTAITMGVVIVLESELSFLGLGMPLDTPTWGRMLATARDLLIRHPLLILPPGLALIVNVVAFNLLTDGLLRALDRKPDVATLEQILAVPHGGGLSGPAPSRADTACERGLVLANVSVTLPRAEGAPLDVLREVSLSLRPGETVGLVGESGSGKSMTAYSIVGMVPAPGFVSSGAIRLDGQDLVGHSQKDWDQVHGSRIAILYQEPHAALNPTRTIGAQVREVILRHQGLGKTDAQKVAHDLLSKVRIPDPGQVFRSYPHQLSGGMAQRAGLARALACKPEVLIVDEPTSALDVTVQGQMLDLLAEVQAELGTALLFITHDMGVVAEICDRVVVMYAGEVVEDAPVAPLFDRPRHPYTAALLPAAPDPEAVSDAMFVIAGSVPAASAFPAGCRFGPRCDVADAACFAGPIAMAKPTDDHLARCRRVDASTR